VNGCTAGLDDDCNNWRREWRCLAVKRRGNHRSSATAADNGDNLAALFGLFSGWVDAESSTFSDCVLVWGISGFLSTATVWVASEAARTCRPIG